MHTVKPTQCGKYAVVSPTGEEVVKFQYEWLAVSMAEELNRGRVETVAPAGRWDGGAR